MLVFELHKLESIEALEDLKKFNLTIYPALAEQLLFNTEKINFSTNRLEVNIAYCNGLTNY